MKRRIVTERQAASQPRVKPVIAFDALFIFKVMASAWASADAPVDCALVRMLF
ncbi:MAG: hypothetical protein H0U54_05230 [Acidobacteria bacterium]|nr:hypothetical protein [Acidobacteriota bacterium]